MSVCDLLGLIEVPFASLSVYWLSVFFSNKRGRPSSSLCFHGAPHSITQFYMPVVVCSLPLSSVVLYQVRYPVLLECTTQEEASHNSTGAVSSMNDSITCTALLPHSSIINAMNSLNRSFHR